MRQSQFLTFAAALLFAISASAQTITIPDDMEEPVGNILVPVNVDFTGVDVGAFELRISYDGDVLEYKGITNRDGAISAAIASDPEENPIVITWSSSTSIQPVGKLFDIEFKGLEVGTSSLTFLDANNDDTDGSNFWSDDPQVNLITTTFNDGFIALTATIPLSYCAMVLSVVLMILFVVFRMRRIV